MGKRGASADGGFMHFDRLLLPRIEQYAHNNSIASLEATVEYLRTCYPEYQRKQLGPFRRMVASAVSVVQQKVRDDETTRRGGLDTVETRLESRENQHMKNRRALESAASEVSSDSGEDDESDVKGGGTRAMDDSSDGDDASIEKLAKTPNYNLLNTSLMSTYNARPALVIQRPTFTGTSVFNVTSSEVKPQVEKPAFASTDMIAAAASRGKKSPKKEPSRKREREKSDSQKQARTPKKSRPAETDEFKGNPSNVGFKDFGGLGDTIDEIGEFLLPFRTPMVYDSLGVEPLRGLLLHGPPGCGKTMLAEAIANETRAPVLKISAPEIVSGTSGESEAKLRGLFADATRFSPSMVFIDEIDSISSKRDSAHKDMERRIVTQLMTCMDELARVPMAEDGAEVKPAPYVLVVGATNRPDALDPALRRRFEREVCLGIPDEKARAQILMVLTKKLRLEGTFDFSRLARRTPGYVGADLKALTKEAGSAAIRRIVRSKQPEDGRPWWETTFTSEELQGLSITMEDFEEGIKKVQPSTKREGFTEIPTVTFEDVGSLDSVRDELDLFICRRVKQPEEYETLGLGDCGFLLYGPPGCGKTLIAKAVANSAGVNFIYVKAGELLNKYVGESERAVRQLFSRARACSPCIIFFDEVDAIAPTRGNEANGATDRVVNQLLVEMDGLEQRRSIFLLAATNRPSMIDPALLRPGRIGKRLYVPLPDAQGRASILKALLRRMPLASDVDVNQITSHELCRELTGADLQGLVQEACAVALRERIAQSKENNGEQMEKIALFQRHFIQALSKQNPSVSEKDYAENFSSSTQIERKKASRLVVPSSKV